MHLGTPRNNREARLYNRSDMFELRGCGRAKQRPLWGTVHSGLLTHKDTPGAGMH